MRLKVIKEVATFNKIKLTIDIETPENLDSVKKILCSIETRKLNDYEKDAVNYFLSKLIED